MNKSPLDPVTRPGLPIDKSPVLFGGRKSNQAAVTAAAGPQLQADERLAMRIAANHVNAIVALVVLGPESVKYVVGDFGEIAGLYASKREYLS